MTQQFESIEVHSARRGLGLQKWVDGVDTMATGAVLTDATLYYNIPVGKQVLITCLQGDLDSNSDDLAFYLAKCADQQGGGAAVQLHGELHVHTAAAQVTHGIIQMVFNPPILVKYNAASAKSISVYADANDDAAEANIAWCGWVEDIT